MKNNFCNIQENHADNEQPDQKSATKRRRWGTTTATDVAPAFSISTDSLKVHFAYGCNMNKRMYNILFLLINGALILFVIRL